MRRLVAIILLVLTAGCYAKCAGEGGSGPTPLPSVSPTPTATPTPTPTPTPKATLDCSISHLQWDKAPSTVARDAFFEFSPMQWSEGGLRFVKVSDDCNAGPRSFGVRWSVSPVGLAQVRPEPNPFGAVVDRLTRGTFTVTVELEGHVLRRDVTN